MPKLQEKELRILKEIHDKTVLSGKPSFSIHFLDFTQKKSEISISDVVAIIDKLQREKTLKVLAISRSANEPYYRNNAFAAIANDLEKLNGTKIIEYDTNQLDRNSLDEGHCLEIKVLPFFIDYYRTFLQRNNLTEPKIDPAITDVFPTQLPDDALKQLVSWYCPICRSGVGQPETIEEYLQNFSKGNYPKCKDRNHRSRFEIMDGKIIIFSLPIPLDDFLSTKRVLDQEKPGGIVKVQLKK